MAVRVLEGGTVEVRNPHDGSLLAEVAEARAADVDRAVDAAREAFTQGMQVAALSAAAVAVSAAVLVVAFVRRMAFGEEERSDVPDEAPRMAPS